jgi:hypothetical protein|tara:strand:- start:22448 stop:22678 length:231 start_codon:yes stop_codon:yes gene_type:complete
LSREDCQHQLEIIGMGNSLEHDVANAIGEAGCVLCGAIFQLSRDTEQEAIADAIIAGATSDTGERFDQRVSIPGIT